VDHVVAQTAAFSGADVLLRGALAVAAASGSYAVFRGSGAARAETKTAAVADPGLATENATATDDTRSSSGETDSAERRIAETERRLATTRNELDAQTARNDALEFEKASLVSALEEATRDVEEARDDILSRASSDAATTRATELVSSLESQIEALRLEMDEERFAGGRKVEDASSRAEQLADQLQATQRTANKLACELETYRREAYDFDAKQALTNLQLKAAHEKIEALQKVVLEADAKTEARVREKESKIAELTKKVESLSSKASALETKLEETETRLELEVAGSLAAAKKKAMAMLDAYDVTQMGADGDDAAAGELAMREALGRRAEFPPPPGAGGFPGAQVPSPPAGSDGEWLQAYDVEREIHYWYNNITMETVWELPEGARVHDSVVDRTAGDDDLPKHFEGPSGLNSR
jgi:septal ring factor EnvC (AmiA/AmiB activator)